MRTLNHATLAFAIAGAMLCVATRAQDPAPAAHTSGSPDAARVYATKMELPGVPDFAEVTPTLYRGRQPSEEGFENLAKMGINIDVDLRLSHKGSERKRVTALGMQYVSIPWFCMRPRDEAFAKFLQLLHDNPDKKIFVHCRIGDDRVGMNIAAYRMAEQGWTAEEARKEMVESGVNWFHRRICPGLGRYEKEFPERFRTKPAFAELRNEKSAAGAPAN
jgi:tyrosine-protein phosphatase SIW14